jgi:hypothetical protein
MGFDIQRASQALIETNNRHLAAALDWYVKFILNFIFKSFLDSLLNFQRLETHPDWEPSHSIPHVDKYDAVILPIVFMQLY